MPSCLPINIDNLLHFRGVESPRVEFKASWDENTTGLQVLHTICAYANDFQNLNGGYIVIGVAQEDGRAMLPPKGLAPKEIEEALHWLRGKCNTIDPVYQPILSPEVVDGQHILVVWAPGSEVRPHQANEKFERGTGRKYYVRLGDQTVDAGRYPDLMTQLMQLTARVPFDDRRAHQATILDIRETKVREFLQDIRSDLVNESDPKTMYRCLRIAVPVNGHDVPRNVGLLFFSQDPEQWFPGARIEVVQFAADAGGNVLEEKVFSKRPIHEQLRECLSYLENLSVRQLEKVAYRPEIAGWVSYPSQALREALVNAVYHRSYEAMPEPVKVYLYPDRMEIISYPGPVPGIEAKHLDGSELLPPVPSRNRRIGEFLKELRLAEGRGTGLPKVRRSMQENGSPQPRFDFDPTRSYFRVTLPAHPEYAAILALQDAARLRAIGNFRAAIERLQDTLRAFPSSVVVAGELIAELSKSGDLPAARSVLESFIDSSPGMNATRLITILASAHLDANQRTEALDLLDRIPEYSPVQDAFEAAIQEKRAGRYDKAHRYFEKAGDAVLLDVKALHEFAQTKIRLAERAREQRSDRRANHGTYSRILREAREMLERVVQMEAPPARRAWAWFDLGRVLKKSKAPISEIRRALGEACRLQPEEKRFCQALEKLDHEK